MPSQSSWSDFLPRRAVVMARRSAGSSPREVPTPASAAASAAAVPASAPTPASAPLVAPAPTAAPPTATPPADRAQALAQIAAELAGCTRCKLCERRKTVVVGEGNPNAELVFVGEGPGEQEDLQGRPFVGRAGELLDKMIQAMGLTREQVYICNVVKCRPPGNRNPEPDEIASCGPFLARQLDVIQPKIVVALGKFAAQTLLETETPISRLRGAFRPYRGAKLMPTFHPAYLLRNPESKREAWMDLQAVARELGLPISNKKG